MRKKFLLIPVFPLAIISSEKMHVKCWFFFLSSLGSIKARVLSVLRSNMVPVAGRIQFGLLVLMRTVLQLQIFSSPKTSGE
jgi:hypothetical protein